MEKTEADGVFVLTNFFCEEPKNEVLINKNSRELSYPCYALAADGKVAVLESASTAYTAPTIEANGLRALTVNFNDLTWSWERITTQYAMPDSELPNYPTKAFVARDGSMKVWMIRNMAWDGGDINPKLGSGMVKHSGAGASGTGGYAAADHVCAGHLHDRTEHDAVSCGIQRHMKRASDSSEALFLYLLQTCAKRSRESEGRRPSGGFGWLPGVFHSYLCFFLPLA